jgi:integrase
LKSLLWKGLSLEKKAQLIWKLRNIMCSVTVEDFHPHRLRHTFGTKLVLKKMDSTLARQLMRHKSEASFERYTRRALEIEAENQFYEVFGEEHPDRAIDHGLNE